MDTDDWFAWFSLVIISLSFEPSVKSQVSFKKSLADSSSLNFVVWTNLPSKVVFSASNSNFVIKPSPSKIWFFFTPSLSKRDGPFLYKTPFKSEGIVPFIISIVFLPLVGFLVKTEVSITFELSVSLEHPINVAK